MIDSFLQKAEGDSAMSTNLHIQDRLLAEHRQDMQREAEQQRMLAGLPKNHQSLGRHAVSRLGALLVTIGTWMEQVEQREQYAEPVVSDL